MDLPFKLRASAARIRAMAAAGMPLSMEQADAIASFFESEARIRETLAELNVGARSIPVSHQRFATGE